MQIGEGELAMKKREKTRKKGKKNERRSERELDKLVSQTGLKGSAQEMARQYGRGMLEGMNIAYLAVAERLLRAGNSREEIEVFFEDMLDSGQIEDLLWQAEHPNGEQIA